MALLFELVTSIVGLALKPLFLARICCQFGVRSVSIIIQTWLEVLRFAFCLHSLILYRLAMWAFAVLSLPLRVLTALYIERMLEMQLHRLKNELENVLWDREELEERLHVAIKERRMMETMLMELEEEHDEAIVKIELLESEVQDLKNKVQRLKETEGKAPWSYRARGEVGNNLNITSTYNVGTLSWKPDYDKSIIQSSKDHCKDETHDIVSTRSKIHGHSKVSKKGDILSQQKEVALSRSLFSAILSLVVGIIVWEAKDPCTPLIVALFTVVAMSLMSVLQLFITIEHKPASDAVALLSFNWFILGTLAYPTLPRIARVLTPVALSVIKQVF
ncbi:hypothetical protein CDL12_07954 [Handroanthus impetiginosus]|uniref:Uncharacterized protein n=1 Tax=Handroanthus impetiginosus TaxID=429701 RepID=A0A2G9HPC5_9LAMI|nr:hypothetical protein CDL12_07954 [Handroanthus impetiginosus]